MLRHPFSASALGRAALVRTRVAADSEAGAVLRLIDIAVGTSDCLDRKGRLTVLYPLTAKWEPIQIRGSDWTNIVMGDEEFASPRVYILDDNVEAKLRQYRVRLGLGSPGEAIDAAIASAAELAYSIDPIDGKLYVYNPHRNITIIYDVWELRRALPADMPLWQPS